MILVGLSWLTFWLLVQVFETEITKSALITAIIYLVLGVLLEYSGQIRKRL